MAPPPLAPPPIRAAGEEPRRTGLVAAAAVVIALSAVGKLAGFAREVTVAATFGAGPETDGFFTAYALFNVVWVMALASTLAPAIVPNLLRSRRTGDRVRERALASGFVLAAAGVGTVLTVLSLVAAEVIVRALASDLGRDAARVAVDSVRLLSLATIPTLLAGALGGLLHAHERFAAAASSVLVVSVCMVIATVALGGSFGVHAASLGVVVGSVLQLLVLVPDLLRARPLGRPSGARDELADVGRAAIPVVGPAGLVSARPALERGVAAGLGTGLVTAVSLGSRTGGFMAALVGQALATVIFPRLTDQVAQDDDAGVRRTLGRANALLLLLTLPVAAGSLFAAHDLAVLLFQYGAMTAADVARIAEVVVWYAPGILLSPVIDLATRLRYAQGDSTGPLVATFLGLAANAVVLAAGAGLGLAAFGLGLLVNVVVTLAMLGARERRWRRDLVPGAGPTLLAIAATAAGLGAFHLLARIVLLDAPRVPAILAGLLAAGVAYAAVVALGVLLQRRRTRARPA